MRWRRGGVSQDVEDRRGARGLGGGGLKLGLGGLVVVGILSLLTQTNLFALLDGSGPVGGEAPAGPVESTPEEDERVEFVSFVLDDLQAVWTRDLERAGRTYERAKLVLFRDVVRSACGIGEAATGPFYCPADGKVYVDLGFFDELASRFGAPGEFAQAYVLAHEIGHHVQNLLGVAARARRAQEQDPARQNAISVRLELMADCLAGVWARSTDERQLLEEGDLESALAAAAAVGDDRIQRMGRGAVNPETFTHGSSAQRMAWFRRGMERGRAEDCDSFRGE